MARDMCGCWWKFIGVSGFRGALGIFSDVGNANGINPLSLDCCMMRFWVEVRLMMLVGRRGDAVGVLSWALKMTFVTGIAGL